MIAVNEKLLKEYLKYTATNTFDKEWRSLFFQYFKLFVVSINQLINIGYERKTAFLFYNEQDIFKGLSSSINNSANDTELIASSKYKLMLTDDKNEFPYIDINNDDINIDFSATYNSEESRTKAKKHIKALLANENEITIVDKFLSAKKRDRRGVVSDEFWEFNLELLKFILPDRNITLKIYCNNDWDNSRKEDLESFNNKWTVRKNNFDFTIHDRYIKTSTFQIILTSDFLNLANDNKDFTYIVK